MPQQITLLNVFVSCPQDLAAELGILDNVIKELNPRLRDSHSGTPSDHPRELRRSRNRLRSPGRDKQSSCGPLRHLYWNFGSQIRHADAKGGSGTEEEFHLARDRWRKSPDSLRILFYFKNIPDVPVQKLDLKQLAKVQDFRTEIGREILYCDFRTTDDFLPLVREHLWKLVATQWDGTRWKVMPALPVQVKEIGIVADVTGTTQVALEPIGQKAKSATAESADDDVDETLGVLDALVEAQESVQAGFAALDQIASITAAQNRKFEEQTKVINFVVAQEARKQQRSKLAVRSTHAADDLASYARSLRAQIPVFTTSFSSGFEAFDLAMAAWIEEKPKREAILQVRQVLEQAISSPPFESRTCYQISRRYRGYTQAHYATEEG